MNREPIAHFRQSDQTPQPLLEHLLSTSELCGEFLSKMNLKDVGELLGFLHDIGKVDTEFQNYICSAEGLINPDADEYIDHINKKGKIDHSTLGAQIAFEKLSSKGQKGEIAAQVLSLCLASHHSGLIDCLSPDGNNQFRKRIEKEINLSQKELSTCEHNTYIQSINQWSLNNIQESLFKKLYDMREKGIDSKKTLAFKHGLFIRYLLSCLIDADRISSADFESIGNKNIRNLGNYPSWESLEDHLNKKLEEFTTKKDKNNVDLLRNMVSKACLDAAVKPRGIFQLTVPTGGGKTLASLRFAIRHAAIHDLERIFIIIPYTSIIDQNAREIRKIMEERNEQGKLLHNIVLEHHSNLTPERQTYRHMLLTQNWDAPIIITTQVQFLEALFKGNTRSTRRMHQLANSIIIFDEVQNLPIRCIHMFNVALRFLVNDCHSSAVLCTATQPLLDKITPTQMSLSIPADFHIISKENTLYHKLKRVEIFDQRKPQGWSVAEATDLILDQRRKMGNVLMIVNTRKSARILFQELNKQSIKGVYHLSTNMCPAHRLYILDEIKSKLDKKQPVVCISTQLIEAGVDIDFNAVIRHLAGLDSIAQAAGRCNRHGRLMEKNGKKLLGTVIIINPSYENLYRLKDIQIGKDKTLRILDEFKETPSLFDEDLLNLYAMRRFYRYYFFERQAEMGYQIDPNSKVGRNDTLFELLSQNQESLNEYIRTKQQNPEMYFLQSFKSAGQIFNVFDSMTQGVIVPYTEKGCQIIESLKRTQDLGTEIQQIRSAQQYSVNLYENELTALKEIGAVREVQKGGEIFYLEKEFYSNQVGWITTSINTN